MERGEIWDGAGHRTKRARTALEVYSPVESVLSFYFILFFFSLKCTCGEQRLRTPCIWYLVSSPADWWRIETEVGGLPVFGWFSCRVRWAWEWLLQYPEKRRGEQGSRRGTQVADQVVLGTELLVQKKWKFQILLNHTKQEGDNPKSRNLEPQSWTRLQESWVLQDGICVRKEAEPECPGLGLEPRPFTAMRTPACGKQSWHRVPSSIVLRLAL